MGMASEFREFAVKGNVIDLAVGVIIGAAFGKIVDSVVNDLIMPLVGLVFGKLDFSNLFVVLGTVPDGTARTLEALTKAGVPQEQALMLAWAGVWTATEIRGTVARAMRWVSGQRQRQAPV